MPGRRRQLWIASVLFVALSSVGGAHFIDPRQVAPQPGVPQASGNGIIIGQVVDGSTGAPVPEAIVRISAPVTGSDIASTPAWGVKADETGRFVFTDLPENNYWIEATMGGYLGGTYGQRRVSEQGRRFSLRAGERKIDVTLRVWKYAVIGGTVVDEAGEPVVGVAVRALVKRIVAGRPQYGDQSYLAPSTLTDDRGMFRLSQVEPGTYVIAVPSTQATVPVSVMKEMDPYALRLALSSANVRESPPLGHHRTLQIGDVALVTASSVQIPPPVSAGRMQVYRTTYYPAAPKAADATAVVIDAGEERTDLTIALRPTPAVRVSGRLVGPDGSPPPPLAIRLAGEAMTDVTTPPLSNGMAEVGFDTATAVSDAAGRFTLLGVPGGEYELVQANQFLTGESPGRSPYWLSRRITVGAEDLSDLTVEVRSPLRVEGRIEFRGSNGSLAPAPRSVSVGFEAASGEPRQAFTSTRVGTPTFSTRAAGGRYIVRAVSIGTTSDNPWVVQSITLDGKDITDRAFDLQTDVTSIVITYSDRPSRLTGTVKDARGAPSPAAAVLVFPVDRARWTGYGRSPRTLLSQFTSEEGAYTFPHLPPGEYYAIAIPADAAEYWRDPRRLETLAIQAATLTVATGAGPQTLNLTLKSVR